MLLNFFSILIVGLFISTNSYAFKLSPMSVELSDKGKKATKSFRIINTSKEKVKVEAEVLSRSIDIDNKETRTETKFFTIFPPQLEVEPGKSRVLRVSYIGSKVQTEVPYRLIVRQIPNVKKEKKDGAQLNFLFEYVASIYITPPSARAQLQVIKSIKVGDRLELEFKNKGNKHILLRRYKLELSQNGKKYIFNFKDKKYEKFGSQNILAGITRKISLRETKFPSGKINTRFIRQK